MIEYVSIVDFIYKWVSGTLNRIWTLIEISFNFFPPAIQCFFFGESFSIVVAYQSLSGSLWAQKHESLTRWWRCVTVDGKRTSRVLIESTFQCNDQCFCLRNSKKWMLYSRYTDRPKMFSHVIPRISYPSMTTLYILVRKNFFFA